MKRVFFFNRGKNTQTMILLFMLVLKFKLCTSTENVLLKIQTSGDKKCNKDDIFTKSVWLNHDMHS